MSCSSMEYVFSIQSQDFFFSTVEHIPNGKNEILLNSIQQMKNIYWYRSFNVNEMLMGGEFASLENKLLHEQITLNIVPTMNILGK